MVLFGAAEPVGPKTWCFVGQVAAGPLNHPAMAAALMAPGSVLVDVTENELELSFVGVGGEVLDNFSI
eukprot:375151-Prorocentrum_minimum.AAC.1